MAALNDLEDEEGEICLEDFDVGILDGPIDVVDIELDILVLYERLGIDSFFCNWGIDDFLVSLG